MEINRHQTENLIMELLKKARRILKSAHITLRRTLMSSQINGNPPNSFGHFSRDQSVGLADQRRSLRRRCNTMEKPSGGETPLPGQTAVDRITTKGTFNALVNSQQVKLNINIPQNLPYTHSNVWPAEAERTPPTG